MIAQRIREYLDSEKVSYEWLPHGQAFQAQEVAQTLHVTGKHFAKAVVVHSNGKLIMAVLPASRRLDMHELKEALEVKQLEMASESELARLCSGCELGAFPPFGSLYGMDTWVDRSLGDSDEIIFNAGTHTDAVRMKYSDYAKVAQPHTGKFAELP